MLYITVGILTILIVLLNLFYNINLLFKDIKVPEIKKKFKLGIKSEKIIIISRNGCPYCNILDSKIADAKNDYTKILINNDGTYTFDSTFSQLDVSERKSITDGFERLKDNLGYVFPTIMHKNYYNFGLPNDEVLNKIFNIN